MVTLPITAPVRIDNPPILVQSADQDAIRRKSATPHIAFKRKLRPLARFEDDQLSDAIEVAVHPVAEIVPFGAQVHFIAAGMDRGCRKH